MNSLPPSTPLKVTVLLFHPFLRRSQTNRALFEAIADMPGLEARDIYSLYPDFAVDVEEEQGVLLRSDVIVFQHPFYWYNCPSLMKEWIDAVLERGWAYGPGGDKLKGKRWVQAITTGGPDEVYHREGANRFSVLEFLRPFEQTAVLCGMVPLLPFLSQGTFRMSDEARHARAEDYRRFLLDLQAGKIPDSYSSGNGSELECQLNPEVLP